MYNIKLYDYVPEPKPATADRVVAAHYYAAWKKGAAGLHDAFNDLHDYPDRTPLAGYYDEEDPRYCDWEIKWAVEHGVNCFIHCWYRKRENMGKPVTVDALRCGHGLHEALFHAKYQSFMKFAIMFEASPRWCGTDENDMLENLMPFWCENYFTRGNYLIIDNKPVLLVFSQERLAQDCFQSPESQKETFDKCREYAKKYGFDGLTIGRCAFDVNAARDPQRLGYDFSFAYGMNPNAKENFPSRDETLDGLERELESRFEAVPENYVPTVSCFWDPEPRTTKHWIDMGYEFHKTKFWRLDPDGFREELRRVLQRIDRLPSNAWGRKILMIDNWNEWDEGHFIAPSHAYGFGYLQAIREELTARDNLPDYRTPQDLGLSDFNKSWGEPDLSDICRRKFGVK